MPENNNIEENVGMTQPDQEHVQADSSASTTNEDTSRTTQPTTNTQIDNEEAKKIRLATEQKVSKKYEQEVDDLRNKLEEARALAAKNDEYIRQQQAEQERNMKVQQLAQIGVPEDRINDAIRMIDTAETEEEGARILNTYFLNNIMSTGASTVPQTKTQTDTTTSTVDSAYEAYEKYKYY